MTSKQTWTNITLIAALVVFAGWAGASLTSHQKKVQDVSQWTASTHDGTNFPLVGRHRTIECRECHLNLVFEGTPTACESCHWERRQDDRYQLRLGAHCGDCHTPLSWKNVASNKWNHTAETGFPLEGIHRTLDCVDCHGDSGFIPESVGCFDCHEEDYREAGEPDHTAAGFPTQCLFCHIGTSRWEGAKFSHDFFELRGQHRQALCSDCHVTGKFKGLPADCASCHLQDFNATVEPDHQGLGFPMDCEICHGIGARSWDDAEFSHTFFALLGEHKAARCSDCHVDGQFIGLSQECAACHLADYQVTKEPDHERAGFPLDCAICHGMQYRTWEGGEFEHDTFILKGRHKEADCSDCHGDGIFEGRPTECMSCHQDDYNSATDPNHSQLGFPTDCEACHGDQALTWEDADFSHDSFVLNGRHKLATCSDCHVGGSAGISSACVSCHLNDFQNTTDPDHELLGFPTNCEACHGTSAQTWEDADFSHDSFVLNGNHKLAACSDCHVDGGTGISSACVSCHLSDFQDTTDPDHELLGFSSECEDCHGDSAQTWEGAVFDHNSIWPLQGPHTSLDCSQCHVSGTDLPRRCYGCHADDYNATANPDHQLAGFPTDCVLCHFPTHLLWTQAVFDHLFPITSGKHTQFDCTECHLTANFKEFSCTDCHSHNQSKMRMKHRNVTGYVYASLNCYACHPDGKE